MKATRLQRCQSKPDKAITNLADIDNTRLKHRVFNVNATSFSASELVESIRTIVPSFKCKYKPDYRQTISDSWPRFLDDSAAREEWDWKPTFDLPVMTQDMIERLRRRLSR